MDLLFHILEGIKILAVIFGIIMAVGAAFGMGMMAWSFFSWYVLGIRPLIQNNSQIDDTVDRCSYAFVLDSKYKAAQGGRPLTDQEEAALRAEIQQLCRNVLADYIWWFSNVEIFDKPTKGPDEPPSLSPPIADK